MKDEATPLRAYLEIKNRCHFGARQGGFSPLFFGADNGLKPRCPAKMLFRDRFLIPPRTEGNPITPFVPLLK